MSVLSFGGGREAHDAWLWSMGLDPAMPARRRKLRGVDLPPPVGRAPVVVATSDAVPGTGFKRKPQKRV